MKAPFAIDLGGLKGCATVYDKDGNVVHEITDSGIGFISENDKVDYNTKRNMLKIVLAMNEAFSDGDGEELLSFDENKLFRMSKGKCLCRSIKDMTECRYYMPWRGTYQTDMCVWLDKWTGTICLCQEEEK